MTAHAKAEVVAARDVPTSPVWAIYVGGYGAFLHVGTEEEAEAMRAHKARWEGGIGRKRLATPQEALDRTPCQDFHSYASPTSIPSSP